MNTWAADTAASDGDVTLPPSCLHGRAKPRVLNDGDGGAKYVKAIEPRFKCREITQPRTSFLINHASEFSSFESLFNY